MSLHKSQEGFTFILFTSLQRYGEVFAKQLALNTLKSGENAHYFSLLMFHIIHVDKPYRIFFQFNFLRLSFPTHDYSKRENSQMTIVLVNLFCPIFQLIVKFQNLPDFALFIARMSIGTILYIIFL